MGTRTETHRSEGGDSIRDELGAEREGTTADCKRARSEPVCGMRTEIGRQNVALDMDQWGR